MASARTSCRASHTKKAHDILIGAAFNGFDWPWLVFLGSSCLRVHILKARHSIQTLLMDFSVKSHSVASHYVVSPDASCLPSQPLSPPSLPIRPRGSPMSSESSEQWSDHVTQQLLTTFSWEPHSVASCWVVFPDVSCLPVLVLPAGHSTQTGLATFSFALQLVVSYWVVCPGSSCMPMHSLPARHPPQNGSQPSH